MEKPSNDAPLQPATVPALLRQLNAHDAPVDQQKTALRGWLKDNDPDKPLRVSLRRNGYGLLLDETDELKGRKKPKIAP